MKTLKWSQNGQGNWNGKAGPYTLMVVAFHQGEGWWLHPKLPGLPSELVRDSVEGQARANQMYCDWLLAIGG